MPKVYCQELFLKGSPNTWRILYDVELYLAMLLCLHTSDVAVELSPRHERC